MLRLLTSSLAAVFTCTLAQAFSNLTINGNSNPDSTLHLQPNTQYTVSFDTTNDDSNSQWAALLVLDYVSPVPGTRPLMPVCVLAGGLETSTIGSDATDNTISFILNLPPLVVPSSILAGIEVGELTSDGVVLLSTLFTFLGDRSVLTSVESAGVPLDLVETLCSDYAATINSTAPVCIGGSGPDNYADICNFACSNGFCPSPCSCTSTGTGNSPTPADASITGSAAPGLDSTTFDPLCNFACARGFCPDNVCDESVDFTSTTPDLPAMTVLTPFEATPVLYSAGDYFEYENPSDIEFNLALYLVGAATTWDDIDCGVDAAEGPDGDTLGCIAAAVAWLVYSIYLYEGSTSDGVLASSTTTRSQTSSHTHFQVHSEWQPEDNCTTHCLLLARAPFDTWIPIGNGTYNGIFHELHFTHNEKMFGHRAFQGGSPGNLSASGNLTTRKVYGSYGSFRYKQLVAGRYGFKPFLTHEDYPWLDDKGNAIITTEFVGESYENAVASSDYAAFCEEIRVGATMENPTLTTFGQNGVALESFEDALNDLQACNSTINTSASYVVWPVDGTKTSSIQILMTAYGAENFNSLNSYGVLFWKVDLSPTQLETVWENAQVALVEKQCGDNCEDPFFSKDETPLKSNTTANPDLRKRDFLITSRSPVDNDLSFISQVPNSALSGNYYFDATEGDETIVYVIDERFEFLHNEFTVTQNPMGETIQQRARVNQVGSLTIRSDGQYHGTCMLGLLAGATKGVARNINPVLVAINYLDGREMFIVALDWILHDYYTARGSGNPLAVLSMSLGYKADGPVFDGLPSNHPFRLDVEMILQDLVGNGVLPIAATGNENQGAVKAIPAELGDPFYSLTYGRVGVPELAAVAGVDNAGNLWANDVDANGNPYGSNVDLWVPIFGPAKRYSCPYPALGLSTFYVKSGTSGATAKVAGVAAYFLALPDLYPQILAGNSLREQVVSLGTYLTNMAYVRPGNPVSAYNLLGLYNGAFHPDVFQQP